MPASSSASISTDGTPHNPNPPTDSVAPSGMSATASTALATTLSNEDTSHGDPATAYDDRAHSVAATLSRVRGLAAVMPREGPSRLRDMPAQRAVAADGQPDFPDVQLHIVTGKGGTGKTTVAAALALGLAAHGKTVLLCETEGRQGIAQLLRRPAAALRGAPRRPGRDDRCR